MTRSLQLLVILALTGCGVAVAPEPVDSRFVADAHVDVHIPMIDGHSDASTMDTQPFDDVGDVAFDTSIDRWDAGVDARDAGSDGRVIDRDAALLPDGAECDPWFDSVDRRCQRLYGIVGTDRNARFGCCWGQCTSGNCEPLEAGLVPRCGRTTCDIRAGQLCCAGGIEFESICVPRDRGLCR